MTFPYGVTVTVTRYADDSTDAYGNTTTTTTSHTIDDCAVAPRTESELGDSGRTGVIIGISLIVPYEADLIYTDHVTIDGDIYEVDGEPGDWRSPWTGWTPGTEVALKRVSG